MLFQSADAARVACRVRYAYWVRVGGGRTPNVSTAADGGFVVVTMICFATSGRQEDTSRVGLVVAGGILLLAVTHRH